MTIDAPERTEIPTANGHFSGIPDELYHQDRASLSVSGAKILVAKGGPAKFRERMDSPPPPKPEYTFGHAAHALVLGEGARIVEVDAPNWKTKAAQEIRNTAANGVAPMLTHELAKAREMAAKVHEHEVAGPLFERGHAEVSMYATDEETGIRMRGRTDWITLADLNDGLGEQPLVVDFKTCVEGGADERTFARKAFDYGYFMQHPWYRDLYVAAFGGPAPRFLFVVQEKVAPYLVNVIEFDDDAVRLGEQKNREALQIYRDCNESGIWPGYHPIIHRGMLPQWVFGGSREQTLADLIDMESL